MPNWCSNRLEITLHNAADMPALKRWIKAEGGIPDWQTAIAQSIHLLLAGCAGILKPVKPIDFPPLPALTSHGETGLVSPGNIAFTRWVELLMTAPDLDAVCCAKIQHLYRECGIADVTWDALTEDQKVTVRTLLTACAFDWLYRFLEQTEDAFAHAWNTLSLMDESVVRSEVETMDMRSLLPTSLAVELNGFNGRLWQTTDDEVTSEMWTAFHPKASGYELYYARYGVKWPFGIYLTCSDDGDDTHLTVDFESPWNPPSEDVMCAVSARFNAILHHTYAEAGCGFCGRGRYDGGELTYRMSNDLEYSEEENDEGFCEVTGPAYILGSLPHYGG